MSSVMEIQLNKLRACLIRANAFGKCRIISLARIKRENEHVVCSTVTCISVTDDIKINEQNNSIGIGLLYVHISNLTHFQHSHVETEM